MWRHLTYQVAKSGEKENPPLKPAQIMGAEWPPLMSGNTKLASEGGIKWCYLTYKSNAKSGFSLRGEKVGLPRRQCRRELKCAPVHVPAIRSVVASSGE